MKLTLKDALRRGVEAQKSGAIREADRLYTAVLKAQPKHADANHNMGILAVGLGNLDQALPFLQAATEVNPNIEQYWVSYITTLIKLDQIGEAQQAIIQAKRTNVKENFTYQFEEIISQRQIDDATTVSREPPDYQLQRLIKTFNEGNLNKTLLHAKRLSPQFPMSVTLLNICGASYAQLGKFDKAIESFQNIIEINPHYVDAHNNLGTALREKGDLDGAIASHKQAIKIDSKNSVAYSNMGDALKDKCDLYGAIDCYSQAIKIKPDYAVAYNNMGSALAANGDVSKAINSYRYALELMPSYADAAYNMADALRRNGDLDSAVDAYRHAIELKPDHFGAVINLANTLQEKGDLGGAINSYYHALKIKPDSAEAYANIGNAFREQGDLYRAINSHKEAIKLMPASAELLNNMGVALQETGDLEHAVNYFRQAITIEPDNRKAWHNIAASLKIFQILNQPLENHFSLLQGKNITGSARIQMGLLKYQLNHGGLTTEASLKHIINLLAEEKNVSIKNPNARIVKLDKKLNLPQKIVALLHFGRSGTGLIHSLIDSHAHVSTLPSVYFSEFFDTETWDTLTKGGWSELVDRFIGMYPVFFDATAPNPINAAGDKPIYNLGEKEGMTRLGEKKNEVLMVDKALFRAEMHRLMTCYDELNPLLFFQLLHVAYEKSLTNSDEKGLIFYHIHNPTVRTKLNFVGYVPQANWLMMVREPIQSCESWIRQPYETFDYSRIVNRVVTMLFQIDDVIFRSQRSVGVRLEDLKERPKEVMLALSDWMGIDEQDSLYKMTAQGKRWWGDLSSPDLQNDHMIPFGKASIHRKVGSILSEHDQYVLRTLFYPFSVRFDYVAENLTQFKLDLQSIRPMLDQLFDFEKVLVVQMQTDVQQFTKSGSYRYLRACLIDRWNILSECDTYPHMLEPLSIGDLISED